MWPLQKAHETPSAIRDVAPVNEQELLVRVQGLDEQSALTLRRNVVAINGINSFEAAESETPESGRGGVSFDFLNWTLAVDTKLIESAVSGFVRLFRLGGSPKVEIEIARKGGTVKLKFDPRTVSAVELAMLVGVLGNLPP